MWGALTGAVVKLAGGAITAATAKEPTAPTFDTSKYEEIEARAKRKAAEGMPFLDKLYSESQAGAATAMGQVERAATSSQDVLGAATQIQQNLNKSLLDVQMQQVNYQQQADQSLTQAQLASAAAQERKFQYDWQNYQQHYADYQSKVSQGFGAMFGGMSDVGSIFTQKYGTDQYMKTLKEISGASVPGQLHQSNFDFIKKITSPYAFGGQLVTNSGSYNPINSTPWR